MGFKHWALNVFAPDPDSPEGDFIADMRGDARFPDTFKHLGDLHAYLALKRACGPAIDAADRVWLAYLKAKG